MRRLIIFLIRRRLGLKQYQIFRFANQRSNSDYYYFSQTTLWKREGDITRESSVSLNWLLNKDCEIVKFVKL